MNRIWNGTGLAAVAAIVIGMASGPAIASPAGGKADAPGADSLEALRVLLSGEVKAGNELLRLKDPALSDSLLRHPQPREAFLRNLRDSSLSRSIRGPEEFRAYWDRLGKENGIPALRGRLEARDVDKSRIPKAYLFDSSVVVYPGWIIVRGKPRR